MGLDWRLAILMEVMGILLWRFWPYVLLFIALYFLASAPEEIPEDPALNANVPDGWRILRNRRIPR